jgi:hypothetical protein
MCVPPTTQTTCRKAATACCTFAELTHEESEPAIHPRYGDSHENTDLKAVPAERKGRAADPHQDPDRRTTSDKRRWHSVMLRITPSGSVSGNG